ncbi:hypothetical protein B0H14DRAFT_2698440, partial [Mycena olivaceomarginata]
EDNPDDPALAGRAGSATAWRGRGALRQRWWMRGCGNDARSERGRTSPLGCSPARTSGCRWIATTTAMKQGRGAGRGRAAPSSAGLPPSTCPSPLPSLPCCARQHRTARNTHIEPIQHKVPLGAQHLDPPLLAKLARHTHDHLQVHERCTPLGHPLPLFPRARARVPPLHARHGVVVRGLAQPGHGRREGQDAVQHIGVGAGAGRHALPALTSVVQKRQLRLALAPRARC